MEGGAGDIPVNDHKIIYFVNDHIIQQCVKVVCPPIPNSQHWRIMCPVTTAVQTHRYPLDIGITFKKSTGLSFKGCSKFLNSE